LGDVGGGGVDGEGAVPPDAVPPGVVRVLGVGRPVLRGADRRSDRHGGVVHEVAAVGAGVAPGGPLGAVVGADVPFDVLVLGDAAGQREGEVGAALLAGGSGGDQAAFPAGAVSRVPGRLELHGDGVPVGVLDVVGADRGGGA